MQNEKRSVVCRYCREKFTSSTNESQIVECKSCNKKFYYINNVSIDIDEYNAGLYDKGEEITYRRKSSYSLKSLVISSLCSAFISCFIMGFIFLMAFNSQKDSFEIKDLKDQIISLKEEQTRSENNFILKMGEIERQIVVNRQNISNVKKENLAESIKIFGEDIKQEFKKKDEQFKSDLSNFISDLSRNFYNISLGEPELHGDYIILDKEVIKQCIKDVYDYYAEKPNITYSLPEHLMGRWRINSEEGHELELLKDCKVEYKSLESNPTYVPVTWNYIKKENTIAILWINNTKRGEAIVDKIKINMTFDTDTTSTKQVGSGRNLVYTELEPRTYTRVL